VSDKHENHEYDDSVFLTSFWKLAPYLREYALQHHKQPLLTQQEELLQSSEYHLQAEVV